MSPYYVFTTIIRVNFSGHHTSFKRVSMKKIGLKKRESASAEREFPGLGRSFILRPNISLVKL